MDLDQYELIVMMGDDQTSCIHSVCSSAVDLNRTSIFTSYLVSDLLKSIERHEESCGKTDH